MQNHLFDIKNGTDTHTWLPKEQYAEVPNNFEHGVLYMCSWTAVIIEASEYLINNVGLSVSDCAFIDVGCGKGKVLCVWSKFFSQHSTRLLVGIDYSRQLLQACKSNLEVMAAQNYELIHADASTVSLQFGRSTNVFYLYNPFDEVILKKVIANMASHPSYVIYNNPQHLDLFVDSGFSVIKEQKSWHPIGEFAILSRLK